MPDKVLELVVEGVALNDAGTNLVISDHLSDMSWGSSNGLVTVSVLGHFNDFVSTTCTMHRRIQNHLPQVRVLRVFEDYVTTAAIALRAGVSRETVRLWANAKRGSLDFPACHQMVGIGEKPSPIWKWAVVSAWLDTHGELGDGLIYPTDKEIAEINALLAGIGTAAFAVSFERSPRPGKHSWEAAVASPPTRHATSLIQMSLMERPAKTAHVWRSVVSRVSR